jgi:tRNA A-37 threonylcarbamoyl transferase component Bud32
MRTDVARVPEASGEPSRRIRKRRRPSGEPPPLPRDLRSSGKFMLALTGGVVLILLLVGFIGIGKQIDHLDAALLDGIAQLRTPGVTSVANQVNDVLSAVLTLGILRWATILVLLAFKRFRHLLVFFGSILAAGWVTSSLSAIFSRARPTGIEILGNWHGGSMPSRPVAALAVTLIGMVYTLIVPGRGRLWGKVAAAVVLGVFVLARLYLAVDHPTDALFALIFGVTIPLVAFRFYTPNDAFPVKYSRGRAAHLDVEGVRGEAIRRALGEQLGLTIVEMKPFGLAGSGGSTPLRLKVEEHPDEYLFGKLYAQNHLRADRWYKLGRTLLYGRLEDEGTFSTVRRLVQYEDYLLRAMRDAGIKVPKTFGFAEITPEREYMLVTEFVANSQELLDAEVDDRVIDNTLRLIRRLWDAGIAHRDVKPSNLLVRDGEVHVIDVAFGEIRPSPWREAVDLANAMVALALRSEPDRVYERALQFFSPEEIAEAFAATRGMTLPSQSRNLLRKDGRKLVSRFRELAPPRRPISIQRWSFRRVGLTIGVLIAALVVFNITFVNLGGAGLVPRAGNTSASYSFVARQPTCTRFQGEMLVLEAQAVPSATMVPCLDALPLGWTFKALVVEKGSARIFLDSDRVGAEAVEIKLAARCSTDGTTEVPSDEAGARRFEEVRALSGAYSGRRIYVFDGGCVTYDFNFQGEGRSTLAEEASLAIGYITRERIETVWERETELPL